LVAVDVEERPERGLPLIRLATVIEPDWLLDLFPNQVTDRTSLEWNRKAERVEAVSQLLYDGFVFDESRGGTVDAEKAGKLLVRKALESGIERFVDPDALASFLARLEFAAEHASMPPPSVEEALAGACAGLRSFQELRQIDLLAMLNQQIDPRIRCRLEEIAPEKIRLAAGRQVKVNYERGRPPWIASRLQDFFGMRETPRIARGSVPLVVHLLAPNQRPVQTTTDLEGFWQRLYPQVRKELMRRYPKHAWPEQV
jgi:ATP-dependent helicase HrpB